MKRKRFAITAFSIAALLGAGPAIGGGQSAADILKRVDEVGFTRTSRMKITQEVETPAGDIRTFEMESYSAGGNDKGLTIYKGPPQVAGMKILTLDDGDDIWTYFPRTNRTRKIASSARNRKVQGSDFTYDDMAAGKMATNWKGSVLGTEKIQGKECYKLALEPTAKGPKSYSKAVAWVEQGVYLTRQVKYWDLDGDELKVLEIGKYKKVAGVAIPTWYKMTNLQDGGSTTMRVTAAKVNVDLDPALFTEAGLSK
jgi:outer membrane lipoprotein-sorting protein